MSKIKKSICVLLLSLTLIMTLPISVFASVSPEPEKVYDTYIQKPTVTETSGYAELLFYNLSTYEYAPTIVVWNTCPVFTNSETYDIPLQNISVTNSGFYLNIGVPHYDSSDYGTFYGGITVYDGRYITTDYRFSNEAGESGHDLDFSVSYNGWQLVGANVYGSNITYSYGADYHYKFSILYSSEAYEYTALREVINSLSLIYYQDMTYYSYYHDLLMSILGSPSSEGSSIYTIDTKLYSIDSKLTNAVSILQSVLSQLDYKSSGTFAKMLSDELIELNEKLGDVKIDVHKILEILEKGGKTQDWANVDSSSITDYENAENEIVKDDTDSFGNNVLVVIDDASYGTLWTVIEMALQQNSIVFGFFFSVLALGVVALVLNR